jgi:hypothetical protein
MAQLQKHVDHLGDGVYGIRFSEPDGPIMISTNQEDDVAWYVNCPSIGCLGTSISYQDYLLGKPERARQTSASSRPSIVPKNSVC